MELESIVTAIPRYHCLTVVRPPEEALEHLTTLQLFAVEAFSRALSSMLIDF